MVSREKHTCLPHLLPGSYGCIPRTDVSRSVTICHHAFTAEVSCWFPVFQFFRDTLAFSGELLRCNAPGDKCHSSTREIIKTVNSLKKKSPCIPDDIQAPFVAIWAVYVHSLRKCLPNGGINCCPVLSLKFIELLTHPHHSFPDSVSSRLSVYFCCLRALLPTTYRCPCPRTAHTFLKHLILLSSSSMFNAFFIETIFSPSVCLQFIWD